MRLLLPLVLLAAAAAACSSSPPGGADSPTPTATASPSGTPFALRLMAGNLSSGNSQNWDGGEGMRILEGTHADVAMLEEFNVGANGTSDYRTFVDDAFGTTFAFAVESTAQIPNAIVSRWPILDSGAWTDPQVSNRGFEWARIDIPGAVDLYAVAVHLLTTGATQRAAEAQALLAHLQNDVPAGSYIVVAGDFNTDSRTEECVSTLGAILATSHTPPADQLGNSNTNAPRNKPYDWVLVNGALETQSATTHFPSQDFPDGLVADTRVYDPIADLAPALAGDSGATGMQHMGVVRDFLVTP